MSIWETSDVSGIRRGTYLVRNQSSKYNKTNPIMHRPLLTKLRLNHRGWRNVTISLWLASWLTILWHFHTLLFVRRTFETFVLIYFNVIVSMTFEYLQYLKHKTNEFKVRRPHLTLSRSVYIMSTISISNDRVKQFHNGLTAIIAFSKWISNVKIKLSISKGWIELQQ